MEIKLEIGRGLDAPNGILVPSTCTKVGRHHAFLYWNNGEVTIEDNESANGTFVNGRRVAKSKITENDVIWLGGNGRDADCYQLNIGDVFASCRAAEAELRTDYTKEFESIKQAYIDYQTEVKSIKKKETIKSQLPMRLISLIPTVLGAIVLCIPHVPSNARMFAISIGGSITGIVNLFFIGKNGSNDKMNEMILELQIKYQPKYCCPKCGMKYPFTTHWKKLEVEGKCPNPKCDAVFVKP